MFTRFIVCTAITTVVLLALPVSAQSPEFRAGDLPGMIAHRATGQMHRSDIVELTLAPKGQPGARLEYKVHMSAGDVLLYALAASAPVVSEFHGESDANKAVMFYREEQATSESNGQFVAPMTGVHGWYLANNREIPVSVQLTFTGHYTVNPGLIKLLPRPK